MTYLVLLWWVAISSVMLAALAQGWTVESQRQREIEMVFRAEQITQAIRAYQDASPGGVKTWPRRPQDLLDDARGPMRLRHLRRWWPDPMTGGEWGLIGQDGEIRGVYSLSRKTPLRAPDGIVTFSAWRFEAHGVQAAASAASSPRLRQQTVTDPS